MTRTLPAVLVLLALGCNKTPEPEPTSSTSAPATHAATAASSSESATGTAAAPADIAYSVPGSWQSVPNASTMRKASFKVPKVDGDPEDGDLAVSMAGGTKPANVARWCNQFGKGEADKTDERTVAGMPVTVVEIKGKYAGMGGAAKDNWMLLGAVVPGAAGQLHFFKLTGPEKTVTAARKDFDTFVSSFRPK